MPTEPNFRMRGDQLHLLIDLLLYLNPVSDYDLDLIGGEREWSQERIAAVLGERFGIPVALPITAFALPSDRWTMRCVLREFHLFLFDDGNEALKHLTLDAGNLLRSIMSAMSTVEGTDLAAFERIRNAIAAGEVTAADFREPARVG